MVFLKVLLIIVAAIIVFAFGLWAFIFILMSICSKDIEWDVDDPDIIIQEPRKEVGWTDVI